MLLIRSIFLSLILGTVCGDTVTEMNALWKNSLSEVPDYPQGEFKGKGIVMPAGGEYYLVNAYVNLKLLRKTGCKLPVEVWYIGKEEYLPHLMDKLKKLGATCRDITEYFDYPIKGFEVKAHAILASQFEEVMLLDADNAALSDPSFLFQCPEYLNSGALFWPDLYLKGEHDYFEDIVLAEDHILWDVLELPHRRMRGQESGQLLIDKKRCWRALNLCVHMNKNSHFYYKHIYGDKDTFFLSFLTTGTPYHMVGFLPGFVLYNPSELNSASAFLQRDLTGNPLFFHAIKTNWSERVNRRPFCNYFFLPTQATDKCDPEFKWRDLKMHSFRSKFGTFERYGIHLLKTIKPTLPK